MKNLFFTLCIFFVSCSTIGVTHTKTQREILVQQEKLNKDAREFLAVAKEMLIDTPSPDDIKKVVSIIDKSQSLLNAKTDDGEEYKMLPLPDRLAAIDNTYQKNKNIQSLIEELNEKSDAEIDKIISKNIELAAIERYKYWENFRFYVKIFLGVVIVGVIAVYIPPDVSRSIMTGFAKVKDKFSSKNEIK